MTISVWCMYIIHKYDMCIISIKLNIPPGKGEVYFDESVWKGFHGDQAATRRHRTYYDYNI